MGSELEAGFGARDLRYRDAVVADVLGLISVMAKTVPLCRTLRRVSAAHLLKLVCCGFCYLSIHLYKVIMDVARGFVNDSVRGRETIVRWRIRHSQW